MACALKLPGPRGCLFKATPARIFDQFASYACASLFYDFVLVMELDTCISLHTEGAHAAESMRKGLETIKEMGTGRPTRSAELRRLVPDFAESIIKERFEDSLRAPLKLAEYLVNEMYCDEIFESSPFHFLITHHSSPP
jgi:hypothetical protein